MNREASDTYYHESQDSNFHQPDFEVSGLEDGHSDYVSVLVRYDSFKFEKDLNRSSRENVYDKSTDYYSNILNVSSFDGTSATYSSFDGFNDLIRARIFDLSEPHSDSLTNYDDLSDDYEISMLPEHNCDICFGLLANESTSRCRRCKVASHTNCLLNSCNTVTELTPVSDDGFVEHNFTWDDDSSSNSNLNSNSNSNANHNSDMNMSMNSNSKSSYGQKHYEFTCKVCLLRVNPIKKPHCCICNLQGGIINYTEKIYYHPFCVYYSYDVLYPYFNNNMSLSNPSQFKKNILTHVPNTQSKDKAVEKQCIICTDHLGVTMKCSFPSCNNYLHPRCIVNSYKDDLSRKSPRNVSDSLPQNQGVVIFLVIRYQSSLGSRSTLFKGCFCGSHMNKKFINYTIYKQLVNQSILVPKNRTTYNKHKQVIDNVLKQYFNKKGPSANLNEIHFTVDTNSKLPTLTETPVVITKKRKLNNIISELKSKITDSDEMIMMDKADKENKHKEDVKRSNAEDEEFVVFEHEKVNENMGLDGSNSLEKDGKVVDDKESKENKGKETDKDKVKEQLNDLNKEKDNKLTSTTNTSGTNTSSNNSLTNTKDNKDLHKKEDNEDRLNDLSKDKELKETNLNLANLKDNKDNKLKEKEQLNDKDKKKEGIIKKDDKDKKDEEELKVQKVLVQKFDIFNPIRFDPFTSHSQVPATNNTHATHGYGYSQNNTYTHSLTTTNFNSNTNTNTQGYNHVHGLSQGHGHGSTANMSNQYYTTSQMHGQSQHMNQHQKQGPNQKDKNNLNQFHNKNQNNVQNYMQNYNYSQSGSSNVGYTSSMGNDSSSSLSSVLLYNKENKENILPLNSILFDNIKTNKELALCYQQQILSSCNGIIEYMNVLNENLVRNDDDENYLYVLFENAIDNYLLIYSFSKKMLSTINMSEFNTQMLQDLKSLLSNSMVKESVLKENAMFNNINTYGIKDDIKYINSISTTSMMNNTGGGGGGFKNRSFCKRLRLVRYIKLNTFELEMLKKSILELRNLNYIKLIVFNQMTNVHSGYGTNGGFGAVGRGIEEKYINYIDWNKIITNIKNMYDNNNNMGTPLKYDEYRLLSHLNPDMMRNVEMDNKGIKDNFLKNEFMLIEDELGVVNQKLVDIKNKLHEKILNYCSNYYMDNDKLLMNKQMLNMYEANEYYYHITHNLSKLFSRSNKSLNLPDVDEMNKKNRRTGGKTIYSSKEYTSEQMYAVRDRKDEEEGRYCQICYNEEENNINVLVKCTRCLIVVHKYCYNIPISKIVRNTEYLCNRCEYEKKQLSSQYQSNYKKFSILCSICKRGSGPLSRTKEDWYHPFCYLVLILALSPNGLQPSNMNFVNENTVNLTKIDFSRMDYKNTASSSRQTSFDMDEYRRNLVNKYMNNSNATNNNYNEQMVVDFSDNTSTNNVNRSNTNSNNNSSNNLLTNAKDNNSNHTTNNSNTNLTNLSNSLKDNVTYRNGRLVPVSFNRVERKKKCVVCCITDGMLIECNKCNNKFHPFCAYFQGFCFKLIKGTNSTRLIVSCNNHFTVSHTVSYGRRSSKYVDEGLRKDNKWRETDKDSNRDRLNDLSKDKEHKDKEHRQRAKEGKEVEMIMEVIRNRYKRYINRDISDTVYDKDKKKRIIHTTSSMEEAQPYKEMDGDLEKICSICFKDNAEYGCSGCEKYIHKSCYVVEVKESFKCDVCSYKDEDSYSKEEDVYCNICLNSEDLLVRSHGRRFFHIICQIFYNCTDFNEPGAYYNPDYSKDCVLSEAENMNIEVVDNNEEYEEVVMNFDKEIRDKLKEQLNEFNKEHKEKEYRQKVKEGKEVEMASNNGTNVNNFNNINVKEVGCNVCSSVYGFMIYCYKKNCNVKFHPNCAAKHDLVLEPYFTSKGMKYIALCQEHSLLHNTVGSNLKNILKSRVQLMMVQDIFKDIYHQSVMIKSILRKRKEIYNLLYPLDGIFCQPSST